MTTPKWWTEDMLMPLLEERIGEAMLLGEDMIRIRVEHAAAIVEIFKQRIELANKIGEWMESVKR